MTNKRKPRSFIDGLARLAGDIARTDGGHGPPDQNAASTLRCAQHLQQHVLQRAIVAVQSDARTWAANGLAVRSAPAADERTRECGSLVAQIEWYCLPPVDNVGQGVGLSQVRSIIGPSTMRNPAVALLVSALTLSACGGEPADTRPGQPVAHRRAAFKEIIKVFEPMGVMLRTGKYDAKRFQVLAQQLMTLRNGPWDYFLADTQYSPSHATDAVWTDAAKFATKRQAFFDATDKLAAVAGTPNKEQAAAAYEAVQNTCQDCHKTFKTR